MRVIAGKYKGRVLKGPKHHGLRPTADRVKEALFNILGARIQNADFLDLFAGTGAVGIEALSRGANSVVFSDMNHLSIKLINTNLQLLNPVETYQVLHGPAERNIAILANQKRCFDIIFLDPPFDEHDLPHTIINQIVNSGLLKPDGILTLEHSRKLMVQTELNCILTRNYGDISLSFFQK